MNEQQGAATGRVYSLSIELWHEMGLQGDMLPVTICLEGDSMRPLIRCGDLRYSFPSSGKDQRGS